MSRPLSGRAVWLATAASLALLPGALAAQETPATPGYQWLGRLTYFATRLPRPVLEVPASVTVVEAEQIEAQNITDMQQLTRYTPGVNVNRQAATPQPFGDLGGFTIRGAAGNRVMMLVDGARVPEQITDGSRDYMDFSFVRQAEIVRGPSSVLWGADALGGVVALRTILPEDVLEGRQQGGTARLSFDSFNHEAAGAVTLAQRLSDRLSFVVGVSRQNHAEATLSNAGEAMTRYGQTCTRNLAWGATPCDEFNPLVSRNTRVLARLHWTPVDGHELTFSFDALRRDQTAHNNTALGPNATGTTTTYSDRRERETRRTRYAVEHLWTLQSALADQVRTTLSFTPNSMNTEWFVRTGTPTTQSLAHNWLYYAEDFLEFDIQASRSFSLGGAEHEVTYGFDGDRTTTDYQRVTRTTNLGTGVVTESRGGGFNFANATTTRADFYIQDRISWAGGRFELTPGLRFATYRMDPRPDPDYRSPAGHTPESQSARETLFSLGARWQLSDAWSVWANAGEGFKMPTAQQLFVSNPDFNLIPAPDLRPEYVRSIEIGARAQFGRGYLSVSAYNARYTDFIQSFQEVVIDGDSWYTSRNLSARETWGVEAAGEWELRPGLLLNGSVAWQQGRDVATAGAAQTWANLPPLTGTLGLTWELPQYALTLDFVSRFATGVTRTATATGFRPGGYALLDIYGRYDFSAETSLNFGVTNLFDRMYFQPTAIGLAPSSSNPLGLHTGPGRTFSIALNTRF